MCGFLGFTNTIGYNADDVIHQMMDKIVHRGPDSDGYYTDDYVALGFRRLSIIDLKTGKIIEKVKSLVKQNSLGELL